MRGTQVFRGRDFNLAWMGQGYPGGGLHQENQQNFYKKLCNTPTPRPAPTKLSTILRLCDQRVLVINVPAGFIQHMPEFSCINFADFPDVQVKII